MSDALYFADSGAGGIGDLFDLFQRPEWHAHAACRGVGADVFFPERGEMVAAAKAICAVCPVRQECFDHALDNGERNGVWGGVSERGRRPLRARRKAATRLTVVPDNLGNCGTDNGYHAHRARNQKACAACLAAHAAYVRKQTSRATNSNRQHNYRLRIRAGFCPPCANFRHPRCKQNGCLCPKCETDPARLPVDHAAKDHLEDDMSASCVGVENGKGGPAGDHLKEAG